MDGKERHQHEADAGHDSAATQDEAALRRAMHKVAWTRMYGRNDAVNPFVDPDPDPTHAATKPAGGRKHSRG